MYYQLREHKNGHFCTRYMSSDHELYTTYNVTYLQTDLCRILLDKSATTALPLTDSHGNTPTGQAALDVAKSLAYERGNASAQHHEDLDRSKTLEIINRATAQANKWRLSLQLEGRPIRSLQP